MGFDTYYNTLVKSLMATNNAPEEESKKFIDKMLELHRKDIYKEQSLARQEKLNATEEATYPLFG